MDNLIIFKRILKIWAPKRIDVLSVIQNLVDLRLGEDRIIEFIDLVWDYLVKELPDTIMYEHFSRILISAMKIHYVSIFEIILERFPEMIKFTNSKLKLEDQISKNGNRSIRNGRRFKGCGGTILHEFCFNLSPRLLNQFHSQLRLAGSDSNDDSLLDLDDSDSLPFDHTIRTYPTANLDLLNAMKLHGAVIDERNGDGMTPLHLAIYLKNPHIVNLLLQSGANPNLRFSKYSMEIWLEKNSNEQVKTVFRKFFEETEAQQKEQESEKIGTKSILKESK